MSDHAHHAAEALTPAQIESGGRLKALPPILLLVGIGCLVGAWVVTSGDPAVENSKQQNFAFKYLSSYMFWLSLAMGGLIFTLIHHASRAGWSTVVRRLAETAMVTVPVLGLLFVPVLLFNHDLYEWTHLDIVEKDAMLSWKQPYLNVGFWTGRAIFFFVVWTGLAMYLYRASVKHDATGDEKLVHKMRWISPLGIVIFGLTLTAAAMDWVMSLDPHWFSTIFGVYYFAGSFICINAFLIIVIMFLQSRGMLEEVISQHHLHDLGKYMFAFTVFWTYIAFSQYFLIWYSNIPEETYWFAYRWEACPIGTQIDTVNNLVGGCAATLANGAPNPDLLARSSWSTLSTIQVVGHFVIPFFFLMSRHIKQRRATLLLGAFLMLAVHFLDMIWLTQPTQDFLHHQHVMVPAAEAVTKLAPMHGWHFNLTDVLCWFGIGGVVVGTYFLVLGRNKLVPAQDPRLTESLGHENYPT